MRLVNHPFRLDSQRLLSYLTSMRVLTLAVTPANSTTFWNTLYFYTASATAEMWITGFNSWNGGGTSYIIFNESDGAITSQAGHGSGSASGLGGANFTDAGMLNDAETFTTILPIADGQLFMQHEMGPQACGIAYVLTR